MRLVRSAAELPSALEQARSEAEGAFGDGDIYIEKAITDPRHIEVQILADEHGRTIHLGELGVLLAAASSEGARGITLSVGRRAPRCPRKDHRDRGASRPGREVHETRVQSSS